MSILGVKFNDIYFFYSSNNDSNGTTDSTEENNNKPDQFTCEFCSKCFKRSQSLRKHILQSHSEENSAKFIDSVDDSASSPNTSPMSSPSSKYSIAELLSKEPKPQQQQFQCKICTETLPNMTELSQHISIQHISKGHPGLLQPLLHNQTFMFPH